MRLDEMVIKANADGKTYANSNDNSTYSKEYGFSGGTTLFRFSGWEELPKRHITVAEAEKVLDCVIDVPRLMKFSDLPVNYKNVSIIKDGRIYTGYYSTADDCWKICKNDRWEKCYTGNWIDLQLQPKSEQER